MPLAHLDAVAPAVVQEDLVEQGPPHLVAVRVALVGLPEVPAPRFAAGAPDHGGAPLLEEAGLLHRLADAERSRIGKAGRQQRLADVVPRKPLALEHHHVVASAGQHGGGGAAAGTAADDDHSAHRPSSIVMYVATVQGLVPPSSLVTVAAASAERRPEPATSPAGMSRRTSTARSSSGISWAL